MERRAEHLSAKRRDNQPLHLSPEDLPCQLPSLSASSFPHNLYMEVAESEIKQGQNLTQSGADAHVSRGRFPP